MTDRFNEWINRHQRALLSVILALTLVLLALALSGCSTFSRGSLPEQAAPGHGLGTQLASVGGYFTWVGLVVAGLALVACCIPILAPFRPSLIVVGEFAGGSALVGGFFVWLADNIWLVVVSCVLTALAYAWYRRAWLRRWLDRFKASAVKP